MLAANSSLMDRLEALSLTGHICNARALESLAPLLDAATALKQLELIDIPQTPSRLKRSKRTSRAHPLPPMHQRDQCSAALHSALAAMTRVTHLTLRTSCVHLASCVELPSLKVLDADCAVCQRTHCRAPLPMHRALLCPAAEAVTMRLHACQHGELVCTDAEMLRKSVLGDFRPDADKLLDEAIPCCFPAARTLSIRESELEAASHTAMPLWALFGDTPLHTPNIRELDLGDVDVGSVAAVLEMVMVLPCHNSLRHISLVPRTGARPRSNEDDNEDQLVMMPAFSGSLDSVQLPLTRRADTLPLGRLGEAIRAMPTCASVAIVQPPLIVGPLSVPESDGAMELWRQVHDGWGRRIPMPHVRELELVNFQLGVKATPAALRGVFGAFSGVEVLRLRVCSAAASAPGPEMLARVEEAAACSMPELQLVEVVHEGDSGAEERQVLHPRLHLGLPKALGDAGGPGWAQGVSGAAACDANVTRKKRVRCCECCGLPLEDEQEAERQAQRRRL